MPTYTEVLELMKSFEKDRVVPDIESVKGKSGVGSERPETHDKYKSEYERVLEAVKRSPDKSSLIDALSSGN